uniref:Putative secreted protein n=1 Tax=Xenopsylla cheopis TaxID=163159 RepID=A0A6M2DF73_XENCH
MSAILRKTSEETRILRLVYCLYTQFRRSICTSESLRFSIRVFPGFNLTRHNFSYLGSHMLLMNLFWQCE